MEYFEKLEQNPYEDLYWNFPEQKQGVVNVIGGNAQNFRAAIKISEYLAGNYPVGKVDVVLPEILKNSLPPMENFKFLPATESGSFSGDGLKEVLNIADYNLIIGDLSKNVITGKAVVSSCETSEKPVLITRDAVDLIADNAPEKLLMNDRIVLFGSMAQMQKLLRAVYYPKILLLSQSLIQVAETMQKFTLSYPVGVVTLHSGQILIAKDGIIKDIPLEESGYSPIMFWNGE